MRTSLLHLSAQCILVLSIVNCCFAGPSDKTDGEILECINRVAMTMSTLVRLFPVVLHETDFGAEFLRSEGGEQFNCMRLEMVCRLSQILLTQDLDEKQKCLVSSMRYLYYIRLLFEDCSLSFSGRQLKEIRSLFHYLTLYLKAMSYTIHRYQMNELTSTW